MGIYREGWGVCSSIEASYFTTTAESFVPGRDKRPPIDVAETVTLQACMRSVLLSLWSANCRDDASVWSCLFESGYVSSAQPVTRLPAAVVSPGAASPSLASEKSPLAGDDNSTVLPISQLQSDSCEQLKAVVAHRAARVSARLALLARSSHTTPSKPVENAALLMLNEVASAAPGSTVWALSRFVRMGDLPDENRGLARRIRSILNTLPGIAAPPAGSPSLLAGPSLREHAHTTDIEQGTHCCDLCAVFMLTCAPMRMRSKAWLSARVALKLFVARMCWPARARCSRHLRATLAAAPVYFARIL